MRPRRLAAILVPSTAMLALVAWSVWAQPAVPATETERLAGRTRDFLQDVSVGKALDAYRRLAAGGPLVEDAESLAKLTAQTQELEAKYGRSWNFELLENRRLGNDVVLLTYLYKCAKAPVVWRFTFYRTYEGAAPTPTGEKWSLISVRFDTDLEHLSPTQP